MVRRGGRILGQTPEVDCSARRAVASGQRPADGARTKAMKLRRPGSGTRLPRRAATGWRRARCTPRGALGVTAEAGSLGAASGCPPGVRGTSGVLGRPTARPLRRLHPETAASRGPGMFPVRDHGKLRSEVTGFAVTRRSRSPPGGPPSSALRGHVQRAGSLQMRQPGRPDTWQVEPEGRPPTPPWGSLQPSRGAVGLGLHMEKQREVISPGLEIVGAQRHGQGLRTEGIALNGLGGLGEPHRRGGVQTQLQTRKGVPFLDPAL